MTRLILGLFLIAMSQTVSAQDATGQMTSVVDKDQTAWQITALNSNKESYWRLFPGSLQVKISGQARRADGQSGRSTLSVAFYLLDPIQENHIEQVDVVLVERGSAGAYVTDGHGDGSIIHLETVRIDRYMLSLKGRFEVTLVYTDDFGVTLERSNTRHIKGRFEASVKLR